MVVQIAEWTAKSTELIEKVRNLLDAAGANTGLPVNIYTDNKPINLIFVASMVLVNHQY